MAASPARPAQPARLVGAAARIAADPASPERYGGDPYRLVLAVIVPLVAAGWERSKAERWLVRPRPGLSPIHDHLARLSPAQRRRWLAAVWHRANALAHPALKERIEASWWLAALAPAPFRIGEADRMVMLAVLDEASVQATRDVLLSASEIAARPGLSPATVERSLARLTAGSPPALVVARRKKGHPNRLRPRLVRPLPAATKQSVSSPIQSDPGPSPVPVEGSYRLVLQGGALSPSSPPSPSPTSPASLHPRDQSSPSPSPLLGASQPSKSSRSRSNQPYCPDEPSESVQSSKPRKSRSDDPNQPAEARGPGKESLPHLPIRKVYVIGQEGDPTAEDAEDAEPNPTVPGIPIHWRIALSPSPIATLLRHAIGNDAFLIPAAGPTAHHLLCLLNAIGPATVDELAERSGAGTARVRASLKALASVGVVARAEGCWHLVVDDPEVLASRLDALAERAGTAGAAVARAERRAAEVAERTAAVASAARRLSDERALVVACNLLRKNARLPWAVANEERQAAVEALVEQVIGAARAGLVETLRAERVGPWDEDDVAWVAKRVVTGLDWPDGGWLATRDWVATEVVTLIEAG